MRCFLYEIFELYVEAAGRGTQVAREAGLGRCHRQAGRDARRASALARHHQVPPGTPATITATGLRTSMAQLRVSDDPAPL
jgi:hypothetical protein